LKNQFEQNVKILTKKEKENAVESHLPKRFKGVPRARIQIHRPPRGDELEEEIKIVTKRSRWSKRQRLIIKKQKNYQGGMDDKVCVPVFVENLAP